MITCEHGYEACEGVLYFAGIEKTCYGPWIEHTGDDNLPLAR